MDPKRRLGSSPRGQPKSFRWGPGIRAECSSGAGRRFRRIRARPQSGILIHVPSLRASHSPRFVFRSSAHISRSRTSTRVQDADKRASKTLSVLVPSASQGLARSPSCRGLRLMFDTRHQNRPSCSTYDNTKPTLSKPRLERNSVQRSCCIEQRSMLHMARLVVPVP
jgi:hypothetical protein